MQPLPMNELVKSQMDAAGFDVKLETMDWNALTAVAREGCLSIPDLTANVRRATEVTVEATDPEGASHTIETEGFEARCLLHEIDHLDGILFLDRVDSLATDVFRRKNYG